MADQPKNRQRRRRRGGGGGGVIDNAKKQSNNTSTTDNRNRKADIQLSKALSWVLRHAAPSLGLKLAPDGFVPVEDVLTLDHPRFRKGGQPKYTVEDVVRVAQNNDKQRFRLEQKDVSREDSASNTKVIGKDHASSNLGDNGCNNEQIVAVASCDDKEMKSKKNNTEGGGSQGTQVLCIRANQGHSLKGLQSDQLLTPLTREGLSHPSLSIIHGTTLKAWEDHIQHEGLSRMKRNHIHFATGLPPSAAKEKQKSENEKSGAAPISGMRSSSEIYIYVDGPQCADDGIPFHRSDNGVILTAGVSGEGMLAVKYFEKVVNAFSGKVLWTQGNKIN